MAKETGTATGFIDLYTKLVAFATTGLGGDNWTQVHGYEHDDETIDGTPTLNLQNVYDNKIILKGAGSGSDEIYVALSTYYDSDLGYYNIALSGLNSYDNAKLFDFQAFFSATNYTYFWDQSMTYWFVGNARRLIIVVKVGGVYQMMHMGFMLPYATPTEYAYPLLVGGCGIVATNKHSTTGSGNDFFINGRSGSSALYSPMNTWLSAGNYDAGGLNPTSGDKSLYYYPWSAGVDIANRLGYVREGLDGCHVMTNVEILAQGDYGFKGILGTVEGLFQVTGFNQFSENVITSDAVDYIVFQRVYRTDNGGFVALKWE